MSIPSEAEIHEFLTSQLEMFNEGRREEMTALYRKYAADELIIEYVGQPVGDGWKTFDHMWDNYGGLVKTNCAEMFINGNEGACYMKNVRVATGVANPSIEIYRFEPGRLHIRYFHNTHAAG